MHATPQTVLMRSPFDALDRDRGSAQQTRMPTKMRIKRSCAKPLPSSGTVRIAGSMSRSAISTCGSVHRKPGLMGTKFSTPASHNHSVGISIDSSVTAMVMGARCRCKRLGLQSCR
jgi:hypothetical protein